MSTSPTLAILVTGSNQGLGFETARHLSKHPHIHLFVSGRNPARVQEALEKITKEENCKAIVDSVVIDVTDDDSIKAGVKEVEAKLNGAALDVLVVSPPLLALSNINSPLECVYAEQCRRSF
jgi:NAD(P)-dependent dehydrogenase (short-subunit alcohol dehydrogenase family)